MSEMVERVARKLCEVAIREARRWDTDPAELDRNMPEAVDYAWRDYEAPARAAIEAMRVEPDTIPPAMLARLHASLGVPPASVIVGTSLSKVVNAVIAAALSTPSPLS